MIKPGFTNTVKVEWLPGSRREMQLLEPIIFIDRMGTYWDVHPGDIIDGASIPRFFWYLIGSPFIGFYRRPSVIHDVYCKNRIRPALQVHNMFLEAMLVDGVPDRKAKIMYQAVKNFGPKW